MALVMNIVACIIFVAVYFPESPVYLLDAGKCEELEHVLKNLYSWNKVPEE